MKIIHVINNLYAGGAQTFVVLLAIEQRKLGHEVSLLIIDKLTGAPFEESLLSRLKNHQINIISSDRKPGKNISAFKSIYKISSSIKKIRPDVINSHLAFSHLITNVALKFSPATNAVHILTLHNAPEKWDKLTYLLNKSKPSIYCSNASMELSVQRKSKNVVISNGIEVPSINDSADEIIKTLNLDANSKIVLCVGKLSSQKNYELVAQIAETCTDKNIVFLIAGLKGDRYEQDMLNFNRIPNIHYLGICVPEQIHSLMNKCHCFLNASKHEGLPITVLEAFFIGTPCLLSPIPPHFEIAGLMPGCTIAKTFNHKEYAELLPQIFKNNEDKETLINQRQKSLEKFGINTTTKNYIQFYESIINETQVIH